MDSCTACACFSLLSYTYIYMYVYIIIILHTYLSYKLIYTMIMWQNNDTFIGFVHIGIGVKYKKLLVGIFT